MVIEFRIKALRLTITISLFDLDLTDRDINVGVRISW